MRSRSPGRARAGFSLLEVLTLISRRSLEGFTADIRLHAKLKNGMGKTLEFKDLDIEKLAK